MIITVWIAVTLQHLHLPESVTLNILDKQNAYLHPLVWTFG
jgi:hypothetical protein